MTNSHSNDRYVRVVTSPTGESTRVVETVPASAEFQYGYGGFEFFTVAWKTGVELVAVVVAR